MLRAAGAMLGRDAPDEGFRGASVSSLGAWTALRRVAPEDFRGAAVALVETWTDEGRARFCTVSCGGCEGLVVVAGTVDGRGRELPTVLLRFNPVVEDEVVGLRAESPVIPGSLARLAAV
jgi:hypothetical protein